MLYIFWYTKRVNWTGGVFTTQEWWRKTTSVYRCKCRNQAVCVKLYFYCFSTDISFFSVSLKERPHLECLSSTSVMPSWAVGFWGCPMPCPTLASSFSCESHFNPLCVLIVYVLSCHGSYIHGSCSIPKFFTQRSAICCIFHSIIMLHSLIFTVYD